MNKQRMTIEELGTLTLPTILECCDGYFNSIASTIEVFSSEIDKNGYLPIKTKDGRWATLFAENLQHYTSKKPAPKRFYERVGLLDWISDDEQVHNGICIVGVGCYSSRLIKTGRYFDWDINANKIVGKVEVE